jgi:hypothetical protein
MFCIAQIKLERNDEKKKVEGKKTIVLYVEEDHFGFLEQNNHYKDNFFFLNYKNPSEGFLNIFRV